VGGAARLGHEGGSKQGWAAVPLAARGPVAEALGRHDSAFHVRRSQSGLLARNNEHGLDARFGRSGVNVTLEGRRLGMALAAWGYGERLSPAGSAAPVARANRVSYRRPGVTEWYANGPLGLEQGFTLARPPAERRSGELTLALSLSGDLASAARASARSASFGPLAYRGLVASDAGGRELPARLELRGGRLLVRVDDRGARYPLLVDPVFQQAKLTAFDGAAADQLGGSVTISGDTIVAGAYLDDVGANANQGSVYVFVKPAGGWASATETAKLNASDGAANDELGVSVAISGDTIAAGAHLDDVANPNQGSVYVFVRPGGGWTSATQTAKLTAFDGANGDKLGDSVAISDDTIAAGAPSDAVGASINQGSLYVFVRPVGAWVNATETAKLTSSDGLPNDQLGYIVAVSGDTIAVGAPFDDVGAGNQGSVYVYVRPGGGWTSATETAKLTASDGLANDDLGYSVAVSGDTIAAGAPLDDVAAANQGSVYVFVRPGGGWAPATQTAKLTASDGADFDELGVSVALSGDTIAAGAHLDEVGANAGQGSVYVFVRPGGSWTSATQTAKLTASDGATSDQFGDSVAISGDTIAAGAAFNDVGANANQGSAYVFVSATAPGAPTGVSAVAGNAQATVSFTAPASNGGMPITSYTVTASPGGATVGGSASPITVTGLTNGTSYTFTVTASNVAGTGPSSSMSNAVMPAAPTPAAPSPVTPKDTLSPTPPGGLTGRFSNGRLIVSWQASTDNTAVDHYEVYLNGVLVERIPGTTTQASLRTFNPRGSSVFTVRAVDAAENQSDALSSITAVPTRRPAAAPRHIPGWAWKLLAWQKHPSDARPRTPAPLPTWYPAWKNWRLHPFALKS
jgi:hypothetical protein